MYDYENYPQEVRACLVFFESHSSRNRLLIDSTKNAPGCHDPGIYTRVWHLLFLDQVLLMTLYFMFRLLDQCDGLVVSAPACFEPEEATLALSKWLARTSRTFYSVGPMLPSGKHAVEQEKILSADATKIDTFMERIYKTMGQKSMLFVSHLSHSSCAEVLMTRFIYRCLSARSSGRTMLARYGSS